MSKLGDRINARLDALTSCLCSFLTPVGDAAPPTCMCQRIPGVFPGETYAGVDEDMAWVRLAQIYPATKIGEFARVAGNHRAGIGLDVELGVMRCFEMNDDGSMDPDSLAALASAIVEDSVAMSKAIACCTGPVEDPWGASDWIVGPWQPLGPAGGMAGGTVTIYMAL